MENKIKHTINNRISRYGKPLSTFKLKFLKYLYFKNKYAGIVIKYIEFHKIMVSKTEWINANSIPFSLRYCNILMKEI